MLVTLAYVLGISQALPQKGSQRRPSEAERAKSKGIFFFFSLRIAYKYLSHIHQASHARQARVRPWRESQLYTTLEQAVVLFGEEEEREGGVSKHYVISVARPSVPSFHSRPILSDRGPCHHS